MSADTNPGRGAISADVARLLGATEAAGKRERVVLAAPLRKLSIAAATSSGNNVLDAFLDGYIAEARRESPMPDDE